MTRQRECRRRVRRRARDAALLRTAAAPGQVCRRPAAAGLRRRRRSARPQHGGRCAAARLRRNCDVGVARLGRDTAAGVLPPGRDGTATAASLRTAAVRQQMCRREQRRHDLPRRPSARPRPGGRRTAAEMRPNRGGGARACTPAAPQRLRPPKAGAPRADPAPPTFRLPRRSGGDIIVHRAEQRAAADGASRRR